MKTRSKIGTRKTIRQFGLLSAIALVIANMIGTGIFTTTGFLAERIHSPPSILIAWILGGIVALCGALTYAELAVNMPENGGGEYRYLSKLYHPAVGFLSGWVSLFAGFSAPIAAAALAFGHYSHALIPSLPPLLSSVGILLVFTLLHLFYVKTGNVVQKIITAVKVVLIVFLIGISFRAFDTTVAFDFSGADFQVLKSPAFAVGLIFVMYSYSGWNAATYISGEVKQPAKNLPISLITGTIIVLLIYACINLIYLSAVPLQAISGKVEVAHIVASELTGEKGATIVSLLILIALITSVSAMIMAGSRIYQVMGEDHSFFKWLAHRSEKQSPYMAILLQSGISLALMLTMAFDAILYYVGFTLSLFAGLTVFSVFILRIKRIGQKHAYRTWFYPVTPMVFLIFTAWMLLYTFLNQTMESLIGLATLGVGLIIYFILSKKRPSGA